MKRIEPGLYETRTESVLVRVYKTVTRRPSFDRCGTVSDVTWTIVFFNNDGDLVERIEGNPSKKYAMKILEQRGMK